MESFKKDSAEKNNYTVVVAAAAVVVEAFNVSKKEQRIVRMVEWKLGHVQGIMSRLFA